MATASASTSAPIPARSRWSPKASPAGNHANLQLGLEALFAADGRTVRLVGIGGGQKRFMASASATMWRQTRVVFHEPSLRREDVVLPAALLDAVERHTLGIGRRAQELRAAGRHVKRGLLLYGAPGTGKTHTVKCLAGSSRARR